MTAPVVADPILDLRRAPLADLRAVDFRSADRHYWADEAALHDRLTAAWAGLDDAAWRLPGAAPSDAGGPDWSLLDHVAHCVDWWELATDYVQRVLDGGAWPTDDDYDGGDFDTFNEGRRDRYAGLVPAELLARGVAAHAAVLRVARQLPGESLRDHDAWGWVYFVLHGHYVSHLAVIEPWTDQLRTRQIGNDPFGPDPRPTRRTLDAAKARFWSEDAAIDAAFRAAIGSIPAAAWARHDGHDWSLGDHVGHLATWFDVGAAAIELHAATGRWGEMPADGLDVFNERRVLAGRESTPDELRSRFDAGLARLRSAIRAMTDEDWLDPEGFSWAYEDLHGHVRAHHAMMGPRIARLGWPPP